MVQDQGLTDSSGAEQLYEELSNYKYFLFLGKVFFLDYSGMEKIGETTDSQLLRLYGGTVAPELNLSVSHVVLSDPSPETIQQYKETIQPNLTIQKIHVKV